MGRTRRTWLLLPLSFLIVCVRSDDTDTSTTTITKTIPGVTSVVVASVSPTSSHSNPAPPPITMETQTTRAAPTTAPPQVTVMTTNPPTTAKTTDPATQKPSTPSAGGGAALQTPTPSAGGGAELQPTTPSAGGGAELQPTTPSAGGGAVPQPTITTVSKSAENPTTMRPTSNGHSAPPPLLSVKTTVPGSAPPLTGSPVQTSPPGTRTTVTVPQKAEDTGTPKVTHVPVPTTKGTTPIDPTTKQATKEAISTTAVVTSKSSPDQNLGPSGSTAPTTLEKTTPKPLSVATAGDSGLDLVPVGTKESRVQPGDQTTVQTTVPSTTVTAVAPVSRIFSYSLNKGHQSEEEKELVSLCQQLMGSLEDGNCTISFRHHNGKVLFDSAEITGKVKTTIVTQHFDDITKKPSDNRTLITILASCGALLIMIVILAVCASQHRKPYENQLQLTEELQTVENGYHDNPTLEVMEVGVDMHEKKAPPPLSLNNGGDFNDSWIVPIDNLLKEEGPDEEDTHL